jgi:hypothetical protein
MRGSLQERDSWRVPLTRRAPRVDLSPQAGRGDDAAATFAHNTIATYSGNVTRRVTRAST